MAAIVCDEKAVVDRAVGKPRALQLRNADRRPEFHEVGIDGDGAIRNKRAAESSHTEL